MPPRRETSLRDRVALVTGANRGLGLETARQLAALGATVLVGARTRENAERAVRVLDSPLVHPVQLDVTIAADVDTCATHRTPRS